MILAPCKDSPALKDSQSGFLQTTFADNYPLCILIAEDNIINQKLIERILNKLGYKTDMVSDGAQVFDMLSMKNYNVILMDIRMPEMDGYEATQLIRKMAIEQPYIIAMTANALSSDKEECLQMGMNNYIAKPMSLDEIVKILKIAASFVKERNEN